MGLRLNRKSKIDILALLLIAVVAFFVIKNDVKISDWLHSLVYRPTPQIERLANAAGMNSHGKELFYRYSPQMVDNKTLRQKCGSDKLGCTAGTHIYILDSTDQAQYNRDIVTAAHEMLHVAYSRLSRSDRQAIDYNIAQELASNHSEVARSIKAQLQTYPQSDYFNEAHSYIGSELGDAGPALNRYYLRYFTDRSKTAQAFLNSPEGM